MLVNKNLVNKLVATPFGNMQFDSKGETKDLKPEEQKVIGGLANFEYIEEKVEEIVEEVVEEVPKKPRSRKITPKE